VTMSPPVLRKILTSTISSRSTITMSEDEMNIDDGERPISTVLALPTHLRLVEAGGAVRRRGRGFQNTGVVSVE
jgi:hypothetical protein